MQLDKIKKAIADYLETKELKLFDVSYHKADQILEVLLDEKMSMEDIEKTSDELSGLLDEYDEELPDKYFLDVSTVGVERPIRNEEELKEAIGNYIYVKTAKNEYYGDLVSYEDGVLKLSVKDKTRMKIIEVDYKEIKKVRYAVKF